MSSKDKKQTMFGLSAAELARSPHILSRKHEIRKIQQACANQALIKNVLPTLNRRMRRMTFAKLAKNNPEAETEKFVVRTGAAIREQNAAVFNKDKKQMRHDFMAKCMLVLAAFVRYAEVKTDSKGYRVYCHTTRNHIRELLNMNEWCVDRCIAALKDAGILITLKKRWKFSMGKITGHAALRVLHKNFFKAIRCGSDMEKLAQQFRDKTPYLKALRKSKNPLVRSALQTQLRISPRAPLGAKTAAAFMDNWIE